MSPTLKTANRGWYYEPDSGTFVSFDFTHDASLKLTGDFKDKWEKLAYANRILRLLNADAQD
jgi:hypothetical protein